MTDSKFCSQLGESSPTQETPTRKVGFLLGLGILFMPYIFSWLTFRKGYSSRARQVALGWMVILILYGLQNHRMNSGSSALTQYTSQRESPKDIALWAAKLDFQWRTAGFDNIMEADFTIQNPTQYRIKDIEISCTHRAESGTQIGSNTQTVYVIVEPNSKKVVEKMNMGFLHSQAHSSSCKIVDLVVVE